MYLKGEIKKVFPLILETLLSSSRNPVQVLSFDNGCELCRCNSRKCQLCNNKTETDEFVCSDNRKI